MKTSYQDPEYRAACEAAKVAFLAAMKNPAAPAQEKQEKRSTYVKLMRALRPR